MDDIWSTLRGAMAAAAKTYADADGGSVTRPHIMAAHGLLSNALRQEFDAAMARGYIEAVESEKPAEPVEPAIEASSSYAQEDTQSPVEPTVDESLASSETASDSAIATEDKAPEAGV
ncbi:hypothetical protein ACQZ4Q_08120 [Agrobacterium vitis]